MLAVRLCMLTTSFVIFFLTKCASAQNCPSGDINLKTRVDSRFPSHSVLVYENNSNVGIRMRLYGMKGLGTADVVYSSVSLGLHGIATMNLPPDKYVLSWFREDLNTKANEQEDENVLMMGTMGRLYMASSAVGQPDARRNLELDIKPNSKTLLSLGACDSGLEEPNAGPMTSPPVRLPTVIDGTSKPEQQFQSTRTAQLSEGTKLVRSSPVSPIRDCSEISSNDQRLAPLSDVCEFVKKMDRALPNFTCEQTTQRYFPIGPGKRDPEQRRDDDTIQSTVSATVSYENGSNEYTNFRIDGHPAQFESSDVRGSMTTGDFGSELLSIFRQENAANFSFRERNDSPDSKEYVFHFRIPATSNHAFTLYENGASTHPYVNGELWISAETHEVLRLNILATQIDSAFSSDHVRFDTVFGNVEFGDAGNYLLPKQSETTVCTRRGLCTHNVTQWANCKRLAAKSRIIFSNY